MSIKELEEKVKAASVEHPTHPDHAIGIMLTLADIKTLIRLAKQGWRSR